MAPQLKISRYLIDKLPHIDSESIGYLYGVMYSGNLLVLGLKLNREDQFIPHSFATEVDLCGIVLFNSNLNPNSPELTSVLKDVDITDNPIIINCQPTVSIHFHLHDRIEQANYEVVEENDIWKQFVHLRLETRVSLVCEWGLESLKDAFSLLHKKVVSGDVSFRFKKTGVFLLGLDVGLTGITGEPLVGELCDVTMEEGCSNTKLKKKVEKTEMLEVEMFWKQTNDVYGDGNFPHAPIINHNKKCFKCLQMQLKIDALSLLFRKTKVINVYNILIESLCKSLKLNEQCLVSQIESENIPKLPISYHFIPNNCGYFVTVVYPDKVADTELEKARSKLHKVLFLPMTRPFFRRSNAFVFNEPAGGKLVNPHEALQPQLKDGELSLVQGKYTYFHYLHDNINDDGWGCAYRSLQTICSWFLWQGYTEQQVPSHKQIQECLVRIGDKPSSFINSKQWIGSTEVSFCLETLLGIQSRIITANSGDELADMGPQLASHFKRQGTPIMIGGGVLAHTILGVDYNKSNQIRFLILDPHFKGADDLQQVINKGGCYWKGPDFWKKSAYYNLCLPQVPNYI